MRVFSALHLCTGFIGATDNGATTTLGRNGSDYTASLLAASLMAAKVCVCVCVIVPVCAYTCV
jgi:aspartokinase